MDLGDLLKEIESENNNMAGPSFDDTMEGAAGHIQKNPLAATTRTLSKQVTNSNKKDNLLKYQISED